MTPWRKQFICTMCTMLQPTEGEKKRDRKQRCRETSAISFHTKGCQVLFSYIDDLMMIVWYFKLLPPTRDTLKLLSICLFYYLFDCKNTELIGKSLLPVTKENQLCNLSRSKGKKKEPTKPLVLVSTWFKFTCTNKLFHTMETSNKLGWELWPAWDLFKTPLDLAGACFFYLRENPPHWSNYLFKLISRTTGYLMGLSTVCFANWK